MNISPKKAKIEIGKNKFQTTDGILNVQLPAGEYKYTVSADGCNTVESMLYLGAHAEAVYVRPRRLVDDIYFKDIDDSKYVTFERFDPRVYGDTLYTIFNEKKETLTMNTSTPYSISLNCVNCETMNFTMHVFPKEAEIKIGGSKYQTKNGILNLQLPWGEYKYTVSAKGYKTVKNRLYLGAHATARIKYYPGQKNSESFVKLHNFEYGDTLYTHVDETNETWKMYTSVPWLVSLDRKKGDKKFHSVSLKSEYNQGVFLVDNKYNDYKRIPSTFKLSDKWHRFQIVHPLAREPFYVFANITKDTVINIEVPDSLKKDGEILTAKEVIAEEHLEEGVFDVVEDMPQFPGGDAALFDYLSNNVRYPAIAEENGVQGRIIVSFVVAPDGSITNPKIVSAKTYHYNTVTNKNGTSKDVKVEHEIGDPSLKKEALRVIHSMPKWIPGKQNGKAVRVKYTIPVTFRLQ